MTTPTHATDPLPTSSGQLVPAEDVCAGQYVHVRPLARSGREWCHVRSTNRLRYYQRLDLTRPDGAPFWLKISPSHVLRVSDAPAPATTPEADTARALLRELFPATAFRVRPSAGEVTVTWTDGPTVGTIMAALAHGGVAHLRCTRTTSPLARAAVIVRQAREVSLHDTSRFTALCDNLDTLTTDEWTLGRQLVAFAGDTDDRHDLATAVARIGLDILADTVGLPTPSTVERCVTCHGIPSFSVRAEGAAMAVPSCGPCLPRYADGGYEIASVAASDIPVDRAISLTGRTLVGPDGARFEVSGFSIEAGAHTATLRLIPVDPHGEATGSTWTVLSSLTEWTVD
jgi:hypothetical protein